ncbi:MAG: prepilin-type N-terminal cleavage/methylation domain-containing protein [Candidatus Daviesbacteria bacterium]|nr:prepilin-type N-terminal cleavage/methylation domain-containing protein [Candidatus Daviesbacteria bacterium]
MFNEQSSCYRTKQKGQSLLEVIVVIAVGVVVVGSLVFATIASLRNAQFAKSQTEATKLAQEGIENVRSARNRDGIIKGLFAQDITWSSASLWSGSIASTCLTPCYFKLSAGGTLSFIQANDPKLPDCPLSECLENMFKRVIVLADDPGSSNSKLVTVIVSWNDFSGIHESRLTTILRQL